MAENNTPKMPPGAGSPFPQVVTLPWIREPRFGHTLGVRAKTMEKMAFSGGGLGPSDLVHWGRHYGEKSSQYLRNSFAIDNGSMRSKEEDGYVGYFHHLNGLDYSQGPHAIEEYLASGVGLVSTNSEYFWRKDVDVMALGVYNDTRPMVVTLCCYNAFARSEVRVRCVVSVHKSHRRPVSVDFEYSIYSHVSKKMHSHTSANATTHVPPNFWGELAASSLTRLCVLGEDPSRVLSGTVNLARQVETSSLLMDAISRLVTVLPRAHLCGQRARYGAVSTCGADFIRTSKFRNHVVDAMVRVVALDATGHAAEYAISQLTYQYGTEYDYVVCRLLKADASRNHDVKFLQIVHSSLTAAPQFGKSCSAALLMLEQARFLMARQAYTSAKQSASRAVELLPLDFDAWHTLALCYVLSGEYSRALETINAFPVAFSQHDVARKAADSANDIDSFSAIYTQRTQQGNALDLRTFESFFPAPKREPGTGGVELAAMESVWHGQFQRQPHLRHPVCGPFQRTPLAFATSLERAAVDPRLLRLAGPDATKLALAAQSSGDPYSSILDFDHKSTWGRTYDLLTLMVTLVGWDQLVHVKNTTFRSTKASKSGLKSTLSSTGEFVVDHANLVAADLKQWLQSLFLVVYDDIHAMVQLSGQNSDRSALSWGLIGLVGWACKFNLKDNLSAIYTSVSGNSPDAGFDYYGTVKMLEIYNEFVLSDVCASTIDPLSSSYDGRHYTNKLIVHNTSPQLYMNFTAQLQKGHFSLENVLLCLTRLVSWNVRWYNYMPCSLVTETLIKLCTKYDPLVVRSTLQILMKSLLKKKTTPSATFTLRGMFAAPSPENDISHQFVEGDTIMTYMAQLLEWIEQLSEHN